MLLKTQHKMWTFWILVGVLLAEAAAQIGFFSPQYEILDPLTGRVIKPKFDKEKYKTFRFYQQRRNRVSNGERHERETRYLPGFFVNNKNAPVVAERKPKPSAFFPVESQAKKPSPFRNVKVPNQGQREALKIQRQQEHRLAQAYDNSILQDQEAPLTRQQDFDFGSLSQRGFPSFFGFQNAFNSQFGGFHEVKDDVLEGPRKVRAPTIQANKNVATKDVKPGSYQYKIQSNRYNDKINPNEFNGKQPAHKWRKKFPYYGRKKRSAQQSPVIRQQTTWVLLDPLTGRPRNNPYQEAPAVPAPAALVLKDNILEEEELREPKEQSKRNSAVLFGRTLHSGGHVYKYYQKYPYTG